jgi:hypothetical protein
MMVVHQGCNNFPPYFDLDLISSARFSSLSAALERSDWLSGPMTEEAARKVYL